MAQQPKNIHDQINHEIELLIKAIIRLGEKNEDGKYVVIFKTLFDDDECQQIFEAMVGTLKAAKKRKILKYKGQVLLQGMSDDVPITLLKESM